jgi:hypothetical protein
MALRPKLRALGDLQDQTLAVEIVAALAVFDDFGYGPLGEPVNFASHFLAFPSTAPAARI